MNFLASKTAFALLFGTLVIAGVVFAVSRGNTELAEVENATFKNAPRNAAEALIQDRDEDGLRDWEEILWKTNPEDPDTDGDGTPDGEEITQNRNPAAAGPDDAMSEKKLTYEQQKSVKKPQTATGKAAQDVLTGYLSLKQTGSLTAADEEVFIESLAEKYMPEPELITPGSITITKESGASALRAYGNAMGAIIRKYSIESENEAIILQRAIEKNDPEELKKLDALIEVYENVLRESRATAVPEKALSEHLDILNGYNAVLYTIRGMRVVFDDPLRALASISKYQLRAHALAEAFAAVNALYAGEEIIFSEDEDGYTFANMAMFGTE